MFRATLALSSVVILASWPLREARAAEGSAPSVDPPATSTGDPSYADELVARARSMHLESETQWMRLGHWYRGASGDIRGEPDGPLFWLAADGKTNPDAELEATIRGIWAREPTDPRVQHPFCRFPARMMWLDNELHFDVRRLPERQCARYAHFARRLRPASAALVFSSYYLNNPSSGFGHTFLRIHKAGAQRGSELLDTGVDFAAVVDTSNALLYAIKGMTGMFPGVFHSLPYYYKVREYNDYESRDLWEYELNLSPRALAMLVAHLWEEGSTWFDYFYLSENCSYHVIAAVEAADPSLHLVENTKYPVLPVDTVRALFANPGLVRSVHYRPSLRSTVRHELASLTHEQMGAVGALIADSDAPLPASMSGRARAQVFDVASDVIDVREAKAVLKGDDARVNRVKQRLLERRAEIALASDTEPVPVPFDKMPHVGHATSRVGWGPGYSKELGGDFFELRYRLALHDLADPPDGYPETSEVDFLPTRLRFYPKARSLELEELSILRLVSLSPWAHFQHPLSWAFNAGAARMRDEGCPDCLAGGADVAGGMTIGFGSEDTLAFYALADLALQYAPGLHGLRNSDWRPGAGPLGGARWRLTHALVWTADARWAWLPYSAPNMTWLVETSARLQLGPNVVAGLEVRRQPLATEGVLSAFLYY